MGAQLHAAVAKDPLPMGDQPGVVQPERCALGFGKLSSQGINRGLGGKAFCPPILFAGKGAFLVQTAPTAFGHLRCVMAREQGGLGVHMRNDANVRREW